MTPAPPAATPRLIDATLVACWQHGTTPLDRDALDALTHVLPVQRNHVAGAVPVVAPDAYGHERLQHAAHHAHILHPVDQAAIESLHDLAGIATPATAAARIVVDPQPLHQTEPRPALHVPSGMTWEHRHILQPDTATAHIPSTIDDLLARLPADQRLRIEDPHGHIDLDTAHTLARHPDASRLTIAPSDTRGLATAIARTLLASNDGPLVIATLLGRAPHGAPATEHLVPSAARDELRHIAETLALATGRPIPPEHPWGTDRDAKRVHPGHLHNLVQRHLDDWNIHLDPDTHARLMTKLRARLRPGDRLDGPVLWATLSTITDLTTHADPSDAANPTNATSPTSPTSPTPEEHV